VLGSPFVIAIAIAIAIAGVGAGDGTQNGFRARPARFVADRGSDSEGVWIGDGHHPRRSSAAAVGQVLLPAGTGRPELISVERSSTGGAESMSRSITVRRTRATDRGGTEENS